MALEQVVDHQNYLSHRWKSILVNTPDVYEYVCTCEDCGIEDMGSPIEFPGLHYPNCVNQKGEI